MLSKLRLLRRPPPKKLEVCDDSAQPCLSADLPGRGQWEPLGRGRAGGGLVPRQSAMRAQVVIVLGKLGSYCRWSRCRVPIAMNRSRHSDWSVLMKRSAWAFRLGGPVWQPDHLGARAGRRRGSHTAKLFYSLLFVISLWQEQSVAGMIAAITARARE